MRKFFALFLVFTLLIGIVTPTNAQASQADWEAAMHSALDYLNTTVASNPVVGSEWAILALARAEKITTDEPWVNRWLNNLGSAQLRRKTDYQRVAIALTSLGLDASNFRGRDFTEAYRAFVPVAQRHAMNQTINADIYALIALDTKPYDGDREMYIQSLLDAQRSNGAWGLTPNLPASALDLDITAMAVQALAPYYDSHPDVALAVDTALEWLRQQTFTDPEGTAQMIVALTTLSFATEAQRYVNHLLQWHDSASGGFRRPTPTDPINFMATEQAAYALVAYWRLVNNMNSLYDMSMTEDEPEVQASESNTGLAERLLQMLERANLR